MVKVTQFESKLQLEQFVLKSAFQTFGSLSVVFDVLWQHNVAHALFDGLYPAFLALRKFGLHTAPFVAMIGMIPGVTRNLFDDILPVFSMMPVVHQALLLRHTFQLRMPVAIAGSKSMGQRHMNADMSLHGGRHLQGTRLYRERFFASHGLSLRQAPAQGRAIIINNKRFSQDEVAMLKSITDIDGMPCDFVDWRATRHSFRAQLQILVDKVVHISGPGTSTFYQLFLRDGSVHVNLGMVPTHLFMGMRQTFFPFFMETYLAEGAPYIRALYYSSANRLCGLAENQVMVLLRKAVALQREGFSVPTPPGVNLSPEGKVFKELCSRNESSCKDILHSMNPEDGPTDALGRGTWPGICFVDAWAEYVVYEQGGWHPDGWRDKEGHWFCPLDRKLLREIRSKYADQLAPMIPVGKRPYCSADGILLDVM